MTQITLPNEKEKRAVALSSVVAAIFLTLFKLVVGLLTHSLGILAEALHSGLDLIAALVTYFAVRVSDHPPDDKHQYGHGKIENFSALIETILLLITSIWIIYEAIIRLFVESVEIDANNWAFGVMVISIVVDIGRSRALFRVAHKYNSQALEADALHFSTDIWSSSVVIGGLFLVKLSESLGSKWSWLNKGDAVAAFFVAIIVIYVSIQLGKRAVVVLLDTAPPGLAPSIVETARKVSGVQNVLAVRVRQAGATFFADLTIVVDPQKSLGEAHAIAEVVEKSIRSQIKSCEVLVHVDPDISSLGGDVP